MLENMISFFAFSHPLCLYLAAIQISTISQTIHCFTCLQYKSYENTVGNVEVTPHKRIPPPHCVFYSFEELSTTLIEIKVIIYNLFQFGRV